MEKDLKIQSDEIISLIKELKRVTKIKDGLKSDNFKLIEAFDLLNKNYGKMIEEITQLTAKLEEANKEVERLEESNFTKEELIEIDRDVKHILNYVDMSNENNSIRQRILLKAEQLLKH